MPEVMTSAGPTLVQRPTSRQLRVGEVLHGRGRSFDAYRQLVDACFTDRALAADVLASEIEVPNIGALIEALRSTVVR